MSPLMLAVLIACIIAAVLIIGFMYAIVTSGGSRYGCEMAFERVWGSVAGAIVGTIACAGAPFG